MSSEEMPYKITLLQEQIFTTVAERKFWDQKKLAAEREATYWLFKADREKRK